MVECANTALVSVHFNVYATTVLGGASLPMYYRSLLIQVVYVESIYLTGSVPELKNWDPSTAILMSPENYPIWSSKSTSTGSIFTHLLTLTHSYREATC